MHDIRQFLLELPVTTLMMNCYSELDIVKQKLPHLMRLDKIGLSGPVKL